MFYLMMTIFDWMIINRLFPYSTIYIVFVNIDFKNERGSPVRHCMP